MKKNNCQLLLSILTVLSMSSCVPVYYYQVYKVKPVNELPKSNNSLIYSDANCDVLYDFWSNGGNVGFMIYNKSDKDIYVNMNESFFINNGIAYDYFKNREFNSFNSNTQSSMYTYSTTNSYSIAGAITASVAVSGLNYLGFRQTNSAAIMLGTGKTTSYGMSNSTGSSKTSGSGVTVKEKEIVCIPPKSAKVIAEYNITENLYRDCNLFLYPSKKQINTNNFSEINSPFVFSNRISYTVEGSDTAIKFENKFYVAEITNYPEIEITDYKEDKLCEDEKVAYSIYYRYIKDASPDKFYIFYNRNSSNKH